MNSKELSHEEIISLTDSILNESVQIHPTESNEALEPPVHSITKTEFLAMENMVRELCRRITPSIVLDALVDSRSTFLESSTIEAKDFFDKVSNCRKCPNQRTSPNVYTGERNTSSVCFVLPRFFAEVDTLTTKLVSEYFESFSLHYLVKCDFQHKDMKQFQTCSDYIFTELEFFNPKVFVLCGKEAVDFFFPNVEKIDDYRQKLLFQHNFPFVLTYNFFTIQKGGDMMEDKIRADLAYIKSTIIES